MNVKSINKALNSKSTHLLLLAVITLIFLFLLGKNPFSTRNLISNLEPYPDTIHYLAPAINFTHGKGFYIEREGRASTPNVPLLYSVSLMPAFMFTSDPRAFYFVNIFLSLLSLYFLYKISAILFKNIYISLLVMFFYVTNYFVYWYPNLAMAENLLIPLYLGGIWILLEKVSARNILIASFIIVGLYATKYAAIPLSASFFLLYLIKIFLSKVSSKKTASVTFLAAAGLIFSAFALFEYFSKGFNIFNSVLSLYNLLFSGFISTTPSDTGEIVSSNPWFSTSYLPKNLNTYMEALLGHQMRFLWDYTPIVPKYIGIFALTALIYGLFKKGFRFISFTLLLLIFSQIIFMSTFYSVDARYIYHAIPSLLIGFGLFLKFYYDLLIVRYKKYSNIIFGLILIAFCAVYLFSSAIRIKSQISLNLRYAETPWYYISVVEMNSYFDSIEKSDKKPILISALPPYYVDFFSENRYQLLPLSNGQEYQKGMSNVWGDQDYSDLIALYRKYLNNGDEVYVANYGLGNEAHLHRDFSKIKDQFDLELVHQACFDACNVYKVHLKDVD